MDLIYPFGSLVELVSLKYVINSFKLFFFLLLLDFRVTFDSKVTRE